jgi:hypothetical protein
MTHLSENGPTAYPEANRLGGDCPECGRTSYFVLVGRDDYCVCRTCRTAWCIGTGLLLGWGEEWKGDSEVEACRKVEPLDRDVDHLRLDAERLTGRHPDLMLAWLVEAVESKPEPIRRLMVADLWRSLLLGRYEEADNCPF